MADKDYEYEDGYTEGDESDELEEDREATYEELVQSNPPRPVDDDDDASSGGRGGGSLGDAIMARADMSDMQTVFAELFPQSLGTPVTNKLMVARIEPSALLALNNMLSTNEIMMSDPEKDVNVSEIIIKDYTLLTIGLDGKGRIDAEVLAGAAREEKMVMEKMKGDY